jgi:hypothetical protein
MGFFGSNGLSRSSQTTLSPADLKKMDGYVKYLEERGNAEEKSGSYVDAIGTYLKLVDVLLVFADAVPTYPEWVKCTTSASNYQKKVKQLIALASLKQKQEEAGEKLIIQAPKTPQPKQTAPFPAGKI